jgi:hypothetical protein
MSTEKSREQVVQRKNLVVRQKVSLRVVAREQVARLQMIPRRVVNEQKYPNENVLKKRVLDFLNFLRNVDELSASKSQSSTSLSSPKFRMHTRPANWP